MLENIILNAKRNYEKISELIKDCKTKNELINKVRQENVIIDEYKDIVNIIEDELKVVVNVKNGINIEKVLIFDENFEDYVNLF